MPSDHRLKVLDLKMANKENSLRLFPALSVARAALNRLKLFVIRELRNDRSTADELVAFER